MISSVNNTKLDVNNIKLELTEGRETILRTYSVSCLQYKLANKH